MSPWPGSSSCRMVASPRRLHRRWSPSRGRDGRYLSTPLAVGALYVRCPCSRPMRSSAFFHQREGITEKTNRRCGKTARILGLGSLFIGKRPSACQIVYQHDAVLSPNPSADLRIRIVPRVANPATPLPLRAYRRQEECARSNGSLPAEYHEIVFLGVNPPVCGFRGSVSYAGAMTIASEEGFPWG